MLTLLAPNSLLFTRRTSISPPIPTFKSLDRQIPPHIPHDLFQLSPPRLALFPLLLPLYPLSLPLFPLFSTLQNSSNPNSRITLSLLVQNP